VLHIRISDCQPGMKLALPAHHPAARSQTLLRAGYELSTRDIRRLEELGVGRVWVEYPPMAFLEQYIDPDVLRRRGDLVDQVAASFQQAQRSASAKLPFHVYRDRLGDLVRQLVGNPSAAVFLGDLIDDPKDPLARHSQEVSYLALLTGLKLQGYLVHERRHISPVKAKEVTSLGLGAMLHDIGMLRLDEPEVWKRKWPAPGDPAPPAWQEHTLRGYEWTRGEIEPTAANILLHHHQAMDGSGYGDPYKAPMEGGRIHVFSRIVAAVNVFDRMRRPSPGVVQPTVFVLASMLQRPWSQRLDPQVMRALLTVAPPYAPGRFVTLSDGRHAIVRDHKPEQPCRPLVQIVKDPGKLPGGDPGFGEMLDLSEQSTMLQVARCDGEDVYELNFRPDELIARASSRLAG